jgi:hypothetical protein
VHPPETEPKAAQARAQVLMICHGRMCHHEPAPGNWVYVACLLAAVLLLGPPVQPRGWGEL